MIYPKMRNILFLYALLYNHCQIIKPQRMCEGYGSHFVSECVCYRASGYIPALYVQSEAIYSFLYAFKDTSCVDFAENVFFRRYGIICLSRWLVTRLFLDKKHINASWHDYKWLSIWTTS